MISTAIRSRRSRRVRQAEAASMFGILVMAASIPLLVVLDTWKIRESERSEWTIGGPPCPQVEQPGRSLLGRRPLKVFTYGEAEFSRRTGHVSCNAIDEGGVLKRRLTRVCQFTSPWVVAVRSGGVIQYFAPPVGRPATIKVEADGKASCVLAGWFRA